MARSTTSTRDFWLRQVADERFPKDHTCHIRARVEDLLPEDASRIGHLLDLDHAMPGEQRVEELVALLNDRLLSLIERGSTVAGLRALRDEGAFRAAGVTGPALEAMAAVGQ
jgi:hypothetical protein